MVGLGLGLGISKNLLSSIVLPNAFGWTPDFAIRGSDTGGYTTSYNPLDDKPTGTTKWVDNVNGSNGNSGDTEGDAYETINHAITAGADVINIKAGRYFRNDSWASQLDPTKSIAFVATDGPGTVIIGRGQEGLSWSSEGSDTYSTTRSNVRFVIDFTEAGHATKKLKDGNTAVPVVATEVADLAAVQASSGHAWAQVGSTLYFKTHDLRAPDADVVPFLIERNTRVANKDITLYMDGLEVWGDRPFFHKYTDDALNSAKAIGVDCGFRFSGENDNVAIDNIAEARFIRCDASNNLASEDGFNYDRTQTLNTPDLTFLEVDCEGYENGDSINDNGSTSHDDNVFGIRLNGSYTDNFGPGVIDVEGAQTVNYGVTSSDNYEGFTVGTAGAANSKMWLKDIVASGNSNFDLNQSTGGEMFDLGGNTFTTQQGNFS